MVGFKGLVRQLECGNEGLITGAENHIKDTKQYSIERSRAFTNHSGRTTHLSIDTSCTRYIIHYQHSEKPPLLEYHQHDAHPHQPYLTYIGSPRLS